MTPVEQIVADNKRIADLLAAGAEARPRSIPGVLHPSVGLRQKRGAITDELCIRVYVREKKRLDEISAEQRIPPEIGGFPTNVNIVLRFDAGRHERSREVPSYSGRHRNHHSTKHGTANTFGGQIAIANVGSQAPSIRRDGSRRADRARPRRGPPAIAHAVHDTQWESPASPPVREGLRSSAPCGRETGSFPTFLRKMQSVLAEHGSPELRELLGAHGPTLIFAVELSRTFDELIQNVDATMAFGERELL